MKYCIAYTLIVLILLPSPVVYAGPENSEGVIEIMSDREVIPRTNTHVIVRHHAKTGSPYVSIISGDSSVDSVHSPRPVEEITRPDYRMLSGRVKSGAIPYEGPYSDRTKVYVLAGALIATGIATGVVAAAAPAATAAGTGVAASTAGAGLYTAAGATVGVTTLSTALLKARLDPEEQEFTHTSQAQLIEFYGLTEHHVDN